MVVTWQYPEWSHPSYTVPKTAVWPMSPARCRRRSRDRADEVAVVMPRYAQIPWDTTESAYDNLPLFRRTPTPGNGRYPDPRRRKASASISSNTPFCLTAKGFTRSGLRTTGTTTADSPFLSLAALGVAPRLFTNPTSSMPTTGKTGLVPVYRHDPAWANPLFDHTRTVFTVHNLGYHGRCDASLLGDLG